MIIVCYRNRYAFPIVLVTTSSHSNTSIVTVENDAANLYIAVPDSLCLTKTQTNISAARWCKMGTMSRRSSEVVDVRVM